MNRRALLGGSALTLLGAGAQAHHGWGWAEGEQTTLTGTIRQVTIAPPHPTLRVETADQGTWTVELGNPSQTSRAGFVEGVARPGDPVVALGNRSLNQGERRLKAVRVTVGDRRFDIYPERIGRG
ncbi:DUF6152 family protein [Muricoccus radiodurans]|uniref:DUF6152 family protein n=1 Tax=Muricoccus radiodurans TaxID=2231721 RepID=UPI003CF9ECF1